VGLTEREQWLLDPVEQLEKRVAELESREMKAPGEGGKTYSAGAKSFSSSTPATETETSPAIPAGAVSGSPPSTLFASISPSVLASSVGVGPSKPQATEKGKAGVTVAEKAEPFSFADFTWLNGNARTKEVPLDTKFVTPQIRADVDYIYDFNHPKDDSIGGSSEVFVRTKCSLRNSALAGTFTMTTFAPES
jgi:hypothetical protein